MLHCNVQILQKGILLQCCTMTAMFRQCYSNITTIDCAIGEDLIDVRLSELLCWIVFLTNL